MPVGEIFLSAFLKVLFDRLASPELLNFAIREGLSSKLRNWEKTLLMIQAVLSDAEEKQLTDMAVKIWLDDLRDLAYDVEDILDEFATEALGRKLMADHRHISSTSRVAELIPLSFAGWSPGFVQFKVGVRLKIKVISRRMEELCKRRIGLGLGHIAGGSSTSARQRQPSTCLLTEPAVYGRDEDKAKILRRMSIHGESSDTNFHVICIVGMAGVGKTTLARLVYNDKAVDSYKFDVKAWVCVSDDFDILRISKAVLESITFSPCDLKDLNQVQIQLNKVLSGRKFLLVLDDVWSKSYDLWESLKSPFMVGAPGSIIIVTTRRSDVALTIEPAGYYDLKLLSDDDCWSVFVKHAFGSREMGAHRNLKSIRFKVVEKCKGLPLAARTLGGVLRSKRIHDEWEHILESKIWNLSDESGILPVLKLSYHHLPSHLKRCFAYCAILPKDYGFEEKELVFLWMAEGLIQQLDDNKQPEDLGSEYFHDLLSRSIFQPVHDNGSKFTMHDLINDLAQWVSGETCFRLEGESEANKRSKKFQRVRHFSYTCDDSDGKNKLEVCGEVKCLRTFLPVLMRDDSYNRYISHMVLFNLLPKFKRLRVLSLRNYYITELPSSIGGLRHLRYINLSDTAITSLPESTTSFLNLQILILRGCTHLSKLPSNMGNFLNLRHLDITGAKLIKEMPWGMKRLEHLKMLSNFIVGKGSGSSLTDLKRLKFLCRGLCISSLENVADPEDRREAVLSDKRDLDELFLEWGSHFDDSRNEAIEKNVLDMLQPPQNLKKLAIKCYGGARFSSWVGDSLFSNMVLLRLEGCENCTSLPSLGLLSSLKDLIIKDMRGLKSIGYEIYGESNSKPFQSLESLCFEGLLEWEHWDPVNEDDHVDIFPHLCKLSIVKCPKLSGKLPDYLPSLEKLMIDKCGELVVSVSGFPMLCKMEVHGCKRMVCRNEIDFKLLKSMTLSDIPKFKNWLKQSFQNVERLKLVDCEELVHLWQNEICLEKPPQGLHSLTSLRDLCIENCSSLVFFPEVCSLSILKKLEIRFCNSLVSLPEGMDFHNACLERLRFDGCDSLTFIARGQLPSSLKKLEMHNCKQLHCILHETEYSSSASSSSSSSSSSSIIDTSILEISSKCQLPANLKHLHIQNCPELMALSSKEKLPQALEYFCIDSCSKLEFIAERFEDNTALRQIVMYNCRSLQTIPEGLHNLSCLQRILISGCPNIIFFPEGGLPNTYLSVSIQKCEKLKALPSRLHSLNSLQQLTLRQCPSITSFP